MFQCKCDRACLFLGDCCFDYLVECDSDELELTAALHQQYNMSRRFEGYSGCVYLDIENRFLSSYRMVTSCPDQPQSHVNNATKAMCGSDPDKRALSTYMPVENNGVLYFNMFCAACHGLTRHQMRHVTNYRLGCYAPDWNGKDVNLLPFMTNIMCKGYALNIKSAFNNLERYQDTCSCLYRLPDRSCTDEAYHEECNAYSNIVYDSKSQPFNNEACEACSVDGRAKTYLPLMCEEPLDGIPYSSSDQVFDFFDFTGISASSEQKVCANFYDEGDSENPCLVMRCQEGFEVHENRCISHVTAGACYPFNQNRYRPEFHIANLFRSAMILHYEFTPSNPILPPALHNILKGGTRCSLLQHVYNYVLPQNLPSSVDCAVLYFDTMAFANLSAELTTNDVAAKLFPGLKVFHTILLNHDPLSGISCSGGSMLEPTNHFQIVEGGIVKVRSKKTRQQFISDKDPLLLARKQGESNFRSWAFVCGIDLENTFCNANLKQEALSSMDICLKYVLTDNSSMEQNTVQLKSGKHLRPNEFMRSTKGNILVCVATYDRIHQVPDSNLWLVICIGYSMSLACLLATFSIYVRYRALRNLPGLMLMNLVMALFFAQILFLLNTFGLFQVQPILCQVMASAQHYFWLASFAWMACMSLDIFLCLSHSCTTVNTHSSSKYPRYVLTGWLLPLLIPLITNILTHVPEVPLGYNTSVSCWLSNSQGVLFLFAIPVLTIVCINILLFFGSLCRLCFLLKNASFVGRKEDNKQRLAQCIKLSSWMGVSWIFGIVPNFVAVDTLWFVFATANALQGIHIFVAFGLTGKARILMTRNCRGNKDSPAAVSATPTATAFRTTKDEVSHHNSQIATLTD